MEEDEQSAMLHTGEHIFARALQEQDLNIHVRKADTFREDGIGKMYIKEIIPFENIKKAERTVNQKILENLGVSEDTFKNIEEAVKNNPKLRFNEERLGNTENIRVVKIGDYDFSACKHRHVKMTSEILSFAVIRVSYLGNETEIEFISGKSAIEFSLKIKNNVIEQAMKNHFIPEKIVDFIESKNSRINELEKEEKEMFSLLIKNSDSIIELKNVKLSKFYVDINAIIRNETHKCIAITNGQQLIVMKGKDSNMDLISIGEKLKEKGFSGSITKDAINGKVDPDLIEELKKTWKT